MLLNDTQQKYKQFVQSLVIKCQEIQAENERLVLRVNKVKKMTRRRVRDVELLKRRLDRHRDNWRALPMVAPHPKRKIEQKRGPKPKNKDTTCNSNSNPNPQTEVKEKKIRKQRVKKNVNESTDKTFINDLTQHSNLDFNTAMGELQLVYESQAQQLLMMQQRQINMKNNFLT